MRCAGSGRSPKKVGLKVNANEKMAGVNLPGYQRLEGVLEHVPVSKRTWLRWQAQGRFPVVKVGRVTMYRMSDVQRFLDKLTVRAIG